MSQLAHIDGPIRPTLPGPAGPAAAAGLTTVTLVLSRRHDATLAARLKTACVAAGRTCVAASSGAVTQPGLILDVSGRHRARPGQEVWRLSAGGAPLDGRFAVSAAWHRPPYRLPILLCMGDGSDPAEILGSAHVGTTGGYRDLRRKVAATAAHLVTRALSGAALTDGLGVAPVDRPHGADGLGAWFGGWLRRRAAVWHSRLFAEWWTIGISEQPIADVLLQGRLGPVTWLRPAPGQAYWADPFAWHGTSRILCEEYPIEGGPGIIAVLSPDAVRGGWRRESVLMADAQHRSYPFTYAEDGATYVMPECIDGGEIALYRLEDTGLSVKVAIVAVGEWADPTLFRHGGRYWVAATDLGVGTHDNVCLFHAERLDGPWRPHNANPVKLDIGSSRSAGTPFADGGRLFRPAQDCAAAYGAGIVVNEVLALTPDEFVEVPVAHLVPDRRGTMSHGLHTLSAAGSRTLVDGKRMVLAPDLAARRLARRLRARLRRLSARGRR